MMTHIFRCRILVWKTSIIAEGHSPFNISSTSDQLSESADRNEGKWLRESGTPPRTAELKRATWWSEFETAQDTDYYSYSWDNIRIIQKNVQNCIFLTLYLKSTVWVVDLRCFLVFGFLPTSRIYFKMYNNIQKNKIYVYKINVFKWIYSLILKWSYSVIFFITYIPCFSNMRSWKQHFFKCCLKCLRWSLTRSMSHQVCLAGNVMFLKLFLL